MHAKLPGDMRLATAALASADLEKALRAELPDATRVDIHLEPMEPHVVRGEDVTSRRAQLAARMREVVATHPEVRRCVDLELSDLQRIASLDVDAQLAAWPRCRIADFILCGCLPFAKADIVLDTVPTPVEIDRALARLEMKARESGTAVGFATAQPVTIARIAEWAKKVESQGILLVPISMVAIKAKSS